MTVSASYPSFRSCAKRNLPVGGVVFRHQDSRRPPFTMAARSSPARRAPLALASGSRPGSAAGSKTAVNQKVEPWPSRLSTPMLPPIISTSCFADRQTKPRAAVLARGRSVRLDKGREQRCDLVRPYPDTRIGDGETNRCRAVALALKCRFQRYLTPLGELDGIGAEIGQHLAQTVRIAAQEWRNFRRYKRLDAEPLGARLDAQELDDILDRLAQVEVQILQSDLTRLDLGKIQDVIDKGEQSLPAGLRYLSESPLLRQSGRFPKAAGPYR